MGCRGYKVYRHKGRSFFYYNHCDSYPSAFGLRVLHEIPRGVSKEKFEEWVKLIRVDLDAKADEENVTDEERKRPLYRMDLPNQLGQSHLLRRLSALISFGQYAARRSVR